MKIGSYPLDTLCRLAPMAGISNIPFRLICKEMGSSLTTSEEISAAGLVRNQARTGELARYLYEEKPIAMQLVGSDPTILAEASKILVDNGANIIDLNMGCPVPKITKTGAGSALMKDPLQCARLLRTIRRAIPHNPFTIKIRGGWSDQQVNAPEISQIAEKEGVDAITVHPRTRSQAFSGVAPWNIIQSVVESVSIPVTGNGDVKSFSDAFSMKEKTGCKSVMIGRGALGNPWVFHPTMESWSLKKQHEYKQKIINRHFQLMETHFSERFACIQMKKHLAWYIRNTQGAAQARQIIFALKTKQDVHGFFEDYWGRCGPSDSN